MDEEGPGPSNWRNRQGNRSRSRNENTRRFANDDYSQRNRFPRTNVHMNLQNEDRQMRRNDGFGQGYRRNDGMPNENNDPPRRHDMRGGRGNNMRAGRDQDRFRFIGFKTLEDIAGADEKDVLQKINEKREGFMNLLNSPIEKRDVFVLLVEILAKITQSPFVELKSKLIFDVCNSDFFNFLRLYLTDLPYVESKSANNLYWRDQSEFWKNFFIFCEDIVDTAPALALKKCRVLIESVTKTCLEFLQEKHGFNLPESLVLKLDEIRQKMTAYTDRYQQPEGKRMRIDNMHDPEVQPPESFRTLSLVPNKEDLMGCKPFLRPNIIAGGYNDVEHYLDVQFRLLREDCFGPFRDGLNQYLGDPNRRKYDHVRIFPNVRFVCPYVDNLKIGAIAQLDTKSSKNFQRTNWAHNKRFLFGSLVLFTKDNCHSFMAATILDRDVNLLSSGRLPVSIIDADIDNSIYNDDKYTMIESEVYFEPYYHVLKALQEPTFPQHLAMQQYIVKVDAASKPPAYLTAETEFVIKDDKLKDLHAELLELQVDGIFGSDSDDENMPGVIMNQNQIKFKVLQPETWPTKEQLKFNASQYEAYRLALTHEFAVIQGPPGTGKTYIGIQVAKTLLHNVKSDGNCLMLVICYTNHALDQFLEAISHITRSIVRIGSQSRNKAMEEFNLSNLRSKALKRDLYKSHIFFMEQKEILRESIINLQKALKTLDILNYGVLSSFALREYEDVPIINLLDLYYKENRMEIEDPMEYWLFEAALEYNSPYRRNFEDCLLDYDVSTNNEDVDERRAEMILENEKESHEKRYLESFVKTNASFLTSSAKSEIRTLIAFYKESREFNERYNLQNAIVDLDSRINLFNEMVNVRHREVRLHLHNRTNFSAITTQNRWALYFTWIRNKIPEVKEQIAHLQASVNPSITAYDEARMMMDVQLLKNKRVKVLGMTTSGAARMRKLLQAIAPKIVIVEEAAEVLEQHIITSLTQDCQHFILIGDHLQLRPSAAHIKLAKQYNIEVSLFERMITNGMHSRRLNVQHRMRPEIAALISPHIYSDLENHPSVEEYPVVPGVEKSVYFFTHDYKEENLHDSNSRANFKEADMTLALANYLMQQGYVADDITILAAYSGQMFYMRKERQNYASLAHVKITVVDNYQGEESKIILLSLVRNNSENSIGFLGTENRICVALSRAKQGFYIFGNIDMLKTKSELWRKIATTLESNGSLGSKLILKCQNHPDQITEISTPEDFSKLPPEGGCFERCNYQYHCGHKCQLYCHGYDREHIKTKCTMNCERVICELGHVCPLKCRDDCEPCKVYVLKKLPCGHDMNVFCHREPDDPKNQCLTQVEVTLSNCGHKAKKDCYRDINKVKCPEDCVFRLDECGHVCVRKCHVTDDPNHEKYICTKPCARARAGCTAELIGDRGDHQCRKRCCDKCDDCHVQVDKKRSTCKHVQRVACCENVDEIPCQKKCARIMTCGHHCKKKCSEMCGDCKQMVTKVIPECKHEVKVQCMQAATRSLCTAACARTLPCGHACRARCAAPCDAAACTQPARAVPSPCGHSVMLPCNIAAAYDKGLVDGAGVAAQCRAACGAELSCGHACGGSCARCQHGRLHAPCTQVCNQNNICGHQCQEPCNQICPPCKMLCEVKCPHSHCKKFCGEPCMPCQEKCYRRCPHGACSRRCGEPCDRAPCDERCPRRLPCGHMCRGLCGEPCPPVCNVCRPGDFPTDFLGDEYTDDDKFILLQDCGHVLELDNMDTLMLGDQENIKIRTCPFCRKAIINTARYKDVVNKMFKNDINPIKVRVYGTNRQIGEKIKQLRGNVAVFSEKYDVILKGYPELKATFANFVNLVITQNKVSLLHLEMECVYLNIFEMIVECWQKYENNNVITLKQELHKNIKLLLEVLKIKPKSRIPIKISQQLQKDIGNEIKRLNVIVQFSKLLHAAEQIKGEPKVTQHVEAAKAIVFSLSVFNEDEALKSLKELQTTIKSSGVLSKYERQLIVQAIGLKAGHWYKCPNGHFYCIGECGGAMQESVCPDCGARIGGSSHTLLSGNAHAPEMDGSRFAAWSEQNNMANFNVDDIL
nr:NFX1-type zinc finger-containing protein 1 isoform X1 [Helicoverpa armigera]